MQQEQRFPQQRVTDAEFPYSINGVDVESLPNDPTIVIATTTITSRSQDPVYLKRLIGTPNPYSLYGDPIRNLRLNPAFNFLPRS